MLWKGRRLITSFPQVEKINNKNMKNIHIEGDDIYSLGLSNNICFSVFKEERRWVCKTTLLGRYAFWWEAEGFRARDGFSIIMQNQLFVCDFSAAVSYWKFILAKFIPIIKIFPFGKIYPRIFHEYRLQTIYEHFALITLSS